MNFVGSWCATGTLEVEIRGRWAWKTADQIGKNSSKFGLDKCQSYLSIGPGPGLVDVPLMRDYLPNIKTYYGVEPRPDALQELRYSLHTIFGDKLKKELVEDKIENWSGPCDDEKVDLIVFTYMLYYIPDTKTLLRRCMDWLKPGGFLIIGHTHPEGIFSKTAELLNPNSPQSYTSVQLSQDLKEIGVDSWTDIPVRIDFDVRDPNSRLIDFLLHKIASAEETEKMIKFFKEIAPTGMWHEDCPIYFIQK